MAEQTDITFHYPPELFSLLVDTIPLLNRSKKDVLLFFRGAGVPAGQRIGLRRGRAHAARPPREEFRQVSGERT